MRDADICGAARSKAASRNLLLKHKTRFHAKRINGLLEVLSRQAFPKGRLVVRTIRRRTSHRLVEVIKHPVNRHAGDGDVEPDGQRPAGNPLVQLEALAQGAVESNQDERNNGSCQNGVRPQEAKIERPDCSAALKVNDTAQVVVGEVENQESGRGGERRYHTSFMGPNLLSPDEDVSRGQQYGADSVETSFDGWKIRNHAAQSPILSNIIRPNTSGR